MFKIISKQNKVSISYRSIMSNYFVVTNMNLQNTCQSQLVNIGC